MNEIRSEYITTREIELGRFAVMIENNGPAKWRWADQVKELLTHKTMLIKHYIYK